MCQCKRNLRREELRLFFLKALNSHQVSKKFTTLHEVHEEVNPELVLEDILHINQERVINRVEDIFFQLNIIHLLVLDDDVLSDALHGVKLTRLCAQLH